MIDSHCHLHDPRMVALRAAALERARAAGLSVLVLAGVDRAGWAEAAALVARTAAPTLWPSYGIHPQVVADGDDEQVQEELAALARALRAPPLGVAPVALGEIGLDGLTEARRQALPRQEEAFCAQLRLGRAHNLPLILHVLRTHGPALALLRREGVPAAGGVVHSYSGSAELVTSYLDLGLCLSFAGPVTYHNASRLRDALRRVPRERLLVETDAPDQTPEPHRSARAPGASAPVMNEPAFLPAVVAAVATIRGEPAAEVAAYTAENARRLFGRAAAPVEPS